MTQTGAVLGTPMYMAPEQCRSAGRVTDKTDVYAVGVMLYQLVAGEPPFMGSSLGDFVIMHMMEPPPPLRDKNPAVSEALATLTHSMLVKNPEERPSMREVVTAIERLTGPAAPRSLPAKAPGQARPALDLGPKPSTLGGAVAQVMSRPGTDYTRNVTVTLSPRTLAVAGGAGMAVLFLGGLLLFRNAGRTHRVPVPDPTPIAAVANVTPPPTPTPQPVQVSTTTTAGSVSSAASLPIATKETRHPKRPRITKSDPATLVASPPPPERVSDNVFKVGQKWRGIYVCAQGPTNLMVQITGVDDREVSAIFDFHHVPTGAVGQYRLHGTYDPDRLHIVFQAGEWITRYGNYGAVGMDVRLGTSGRSMSGRITNPSCSTVSLQRT